MAPLSSDPLDILLKHDAWATRRVLDVCQGLTDEQLHRRFEMGPGSIHDTLTHIIGAMRRWADRITGNSVRPRIDDSNRRAVPELITLHTEAVADLASAAAAARIAGLGTSFEAVFPGKSYTFSRAAALVHVTTHGMHHRAQILNMFRQLGLGEELPELGAADWQAETETHQLQPLTRRNPAPASSKP